MGGGGGRGREGGKRGLLKKKKCKNNGIPWWEKLSFSYLQFGVLVK